MDPTELNHADAVRLRFRRALLASMAFVAALGAIFFAGPWLGDTRAFALVPQSYSGLVGVITAPLLHGSAGHWLANASALLILGWLLLTGGAVAFSVCLNSFNRLSKLHEDSQYPDEPSSSPQARSMSDTAEFDIPKELAAPNETAVAYPPAELTEPALPVSEEALGSEAYVQS